MKNERLNISTLQLIRDLNALSEYHYSKTSIQPHDHQAYLKDCNEKLYKFFLDYFNDCFLFSALSFIDRTDGTIKIAEGNGQHITHYNFVPFNNYNEVASEIHAALKEIEDNKLVSMTKILLSENNKFDLFFSDEIYSSEIINNNAKILNLPLSEFKVEKTGESFYKAHKQQIDNFCIELEAKTRFFNFANDNMGKFIWHFKKIASLYSSANNNKPFLIHFIRPSIIEFNYNLLLSLATNRTLSVEELSFVDLFIYRIVSQMVTEQLSEAQKLKSLNSISFATHAIKTTLQGVLLPQAQVTLENVVPEYRSKQEKYIRDIQDIMKLTELVNVSSKIVAGYSKREICENLLQTGLLSSPEDISYSEVNLSDILNNIISLNNELGNRTFIPLLEMDCLIPFDFLKIENYILNEKFYRHFCLTAFENFYTHGVGSKNWCDKISISYMNAKIIVSNKIKLKNKSQLENREITGNIALYKNIVEKTFKVGKVVPELKGDNYTLTIEKILA